MISPDTRAEAKERRDDSLRRKHRFHIGLLVLLISGLIYPASVQAASSSSFDSVLVVYDSLGRGTKDEGNVEALKRLLAAFRVEVTIESIDSYSYNFV